MAVPSATAPSVVASARAELAAAARSRSPGDGGESASTATVATAEASHQPASRSGSMLTVPGVTTDSTKEQGGDDPGRRVGPRHAREEYAERHRNRDQHGQPVDPVDRGADDQADAPDNARPKCATACPAWCRRTWRRPGSRTPRTRRTGPSAGCRSPIGQREHRRDHQHRTQGPHGGGHRPGRPPRRAGSGSGRAGRRPARRTGMWSAAGGGSRSDLAPIQSKKDAAGGGRGSGLWASSMRYID